MDDADRNESGLTPTEPAGDSLQGETEADPDGTEPEGGNRRYGFRLHYGTALAALSATYLVIAAAAPPVRVLAHAIWLSDVGSQPLLFVLRVAGAIRPRSVSKDGRATRVEELDARVESLTTRRFPRANAFTHDPKLVSVRFPLHGAGTRLAERIHQCTS